MYVREKWERVVGSVGAASSPTPTSERWCWGRGTRTVWVVDKGGGTDGCVGGVGDRSGCDTCWCQLDLKKRRTPAICPANQTRTRTPNKRITHRRGPDQGGDRGDAPPQVPHGGAERGGAGKCVRACLCLLVWRCMCGVGACKERLHAPQEGKTPKPHSLLKTPCTHVYER